MLQETSIMVQKLTDVGETKKKVLKGVNKTFCDFTQKSQSITWSIL